MILKSPIHPFNGTFYSTIRVLIHSELTPSPFLRSTESHQKLTFFILKATASTSAYTATKSLWVPDIPRSFGNIDPLCAPIN